MLACLSGDKLQSAPNDFGFASTGGQLEFFEHGSIPFTQPSVDIRLHEADCSTLV